MIDAQAVLEVDCQAMLWTPPSNPQVGALLCWQVGHFCVTRIDNLKINGADGKEFSSRPYIVMHLASGTSMMDFLGSQLAWQFADECSRVCGERLDHEPKTTRELMAAVPDVVQWVQWMVQRPHAQERFYAPFRDTHFALRYPEARP